MLRSIFVRREELKSSGLIGYFGLSNWWLSEFSEDQRATIRAEYGRYGIGISPDSLETANIHHTSQDVLSFLSSLRVDRDSPDSAVISEKIEAKAAELAPSSDPIDQHFFLSSSIEYWHRVRDPDSYERALRFARSALAIERAASASMLTKWGEWPRPTHKGFDVLLGDAIRHKDFDAADALVEKMQSDRWGYDWAYLKAEVAGRRAAHEAGQRFIRKKFLPEEYW